MTPEDQTPPVPRKRRRRLVTMYNVKTALADTLRALENDTMEPMKARTLIYGYSVMAGLIQEHDMEERVKALEAKTGVSAALPASPH